MPMSEDKCKSLAEELKAEKRKNEQLTEELRKCKLREIKIQFPTQPKEHNHEHVHIEVPTATSQLEVQSANAPSPMTTADPIQPQPEKTPEVVATKPQPKQP